MPKKDTIDGIQKSIILNTKLQDRLSEIKAYLGLSTDSESIRYLINDFYYKSIDPK
jgi:hypothetical protein